MIRTQAEVSWQTIGFFVAAVLLSALSAMADEPKNAERLPRLILAHYMPWYVTKPASDQWGWHWTMNHFDPEQSNAGKR